MRACIALFQSLSFSQGRGFSKNRDWIYISTRQQASLQEKVCGDLKSSPLTWETEDSEQILIFCFPYRQCKSLSSFQAQIHPEGQTRNNDADKS